MSVRHALLALLSQGPRHGYQLKNEFDAATGHAWPLNFGQVYTTLQRLEKGGLVQPVDEADPRGENAAEGRAGNEAGSAADGDGDERKNRYAITDDGWADVGRWLDTPVQQPLAGRDELSIKILITVATGCGDPIRVIDRQRDATMSNLQTVSRMRSEALAAGQSGSSQGQLADGRGAGSDSTDTSVAWLLHLDRMAIMAESELRWLDLAEDRLHQSGRAGPRSSTSTPPMEATTSGSGPAADIPGTNDQQPATALSSTTPHTTEEP